LAKFASISMGKGAHTSNFEGFEARGSSLSYPF